MGFSGIDFNGILFRAIAFLIAITVHELGHAFVAYSFGDPTPKREGRITLNPIAHIDWLGALMILFGPIGWAKPVSFNPYNFKGNKRVAMILVTLAGPVANLVVAIIATFLFALYLHVGGADPAWNSFAIQLFNAVFQLNLILFLFNLIPIPPLDGYWIVRGFLPNKAARQLYPLERYGPFLLLLFVFLNWSSYVVTPVFLKVADLLITMAGLR